MHATALEHARSGPLTADLVETLAGQWTVAQLNEGLDAAIAARDQRACTALAFAMGDLDSERGRFLLTEMDRVDQMIGLVALIGDQKHVPDLLLKALDEGRLGAEREAVAAVIVGLRGDDAHHRQLASRIRVRIAGRPTSPELLIVWAAAARLTDDQHAMEATGSRHIPVGLMATFEDRIGEVLAKPMTAFDDDHAPSPAYGFTVRRPTAKVGRNSPCPCGSGKKYKKCCEREDKQRLSHPSPVANLTMDEYRQSGHRHMSDAEFRELRPQELARIPLDELSGMQLIIAFDTLLRFNEWELAEAVIAEVGTRDDLPHDRDADDFRYELIKDAQERGRSDLVLRHAALLAPDLLDASVELDVALASPATKPGLAALETAAVGAVTDPGLAVDFAYSLLAVSPALGILVARGALNEQRILDSDCLLDFIERARAQLSLPPHDRGWDTLAALEHADEFGDGPVVESADPELQQQLEEAAARSKRQAAELAATRTRLREAEQTLARTTASARASERRKTPTAPADPDRVAQLQDKVKRFRDLIDDGNKERRRLRSDLDELRDKVKSAVEPEDISERKAHDDAWEREEAATALGVMIPVWSDRARQQTTGLASGVVSLALRRIGGIAAGDADAWTQVKKMSGCRDVLATRVGIHYRLLFRVDATQHTLEILDLVGREALDRTLKRYR